MKMAKKMSPWAKFSEVKLDQEVKPQIKPKDKPQITKKKSEKKQEPNGEVFTHNPKLTKSGRVRKRDNFQPLKYHIPEALVHEYQLSYCQPITVTKFKDKIIIEIPRGKKDI